MIEKGFLIFRRNGPGQALRILGFAYRKLTRNEALKLSDEDLEKININRGICGMIDPPREGVKIRS